MKKQNYIRLLHPSQCQQNKIGKTPCFHAMTRDGLECRLCPVELFVETNQERIRSMFHDGTCLMDERNPANLGAIAKVKETWEKQAVVPIDFSEE